MGPPHLGPLQDKVPALLAAALVAFTAFVTFHPGGVAGDLLRAWVVLGAGALFGAATWLDPGGPARVAGERRARALPLLAVAVVVGAALLQLVPLPLGLLEALAPASARLRGPGDGPAPVSLDPATTARGAALGLAYALVFLTATRLARHRAVLPGLALGLAALGAACTFAAAVDVAALPSQDAWAYRPRAPFVNPNHLCAFLGPCLALAVALLVGRREAPRAGAAASPSRRLSAALSRAALVSTCVAVIVTGIVLSQSRAGVVTAGLAAAVPLALCMGRLARPRAAVGVALVALAIGLVASDPEPLERRFEQRAGLALSARVELWGVAGELIRARPLVGGGLGTFDDASLAPLDPSVPRHTRPGAAHNDYLELAADIGLPAALAAIAALGAAVALAARRVSALAEADRPLAAGALGGVVGLLLHETVDFPLHVPGPALLLAICLALALGVEPAAPAADEEAAPPSPKRRALALGAAGVMVALGALLVAQTRSEARARAAFARARSAEQVEVRTRLAERALPALSEAAARPLAAADLPHLEAETLLWLRRRAQAESSQETLSAAVDAARRAVEAAPARAAPQALLGALLLSEWRRDRAGGDALLHEGEARLALAVELGPPNPAVLWIAAEAQLDLLSSRGERRHLEAASALFARLLLQRPAQAKAIRAALSRRAAVLGAARAELERHLGLAPAANPSR